MIEHQIPSQITVDHFLVWAERNDWETFDTQVDQICNTSHWLEWTQQGLLDSRIDIRDLAVSILEKTSVALTEDQRGSLVLIMENDQNQHLRRKAAIALFVKGINSEEVTEVLKDAYANDSELRDQAGRLLGLGNG